MYLVLTEEQAREYPLGLHSIWYRGKRQRIPGPGELVWIREPWRVAQFDFGTGLVRIEYRARTLRLEAGRTNAARRAIKVSGYGLKRLYFSGELVLYFPGNHRNGENP